MATLMAHGSRTKWATHQNIHEECRLCMHIGWGPSTRGEARMQNGNAEKVVVNCYSIATSSSKCHNCTHNCDSGQAGRTWDMDRNETLHWTGLALSPDTIEHRCATPTVQCSPSGAVFLLFVHQCVPGILSKSFFNVQTLFQREWTVYQGLIEGMCPRGCQQILRI